MRRTALITLVLFLCSTASPAYARERTDDLLHDAAWWLISDIPVHLVQDYKETFWNPWHFLGMVIATGATFAAHEFDSEISKTFLEDDPLKEFGDFLGEFELWMYASSTTGIFLFSKMLGWEKSALTAGSMFEAFAAATALVFPIKFAVGRKRPDGSDSRSFPSERAASVFAMATIVNAYHGPFFGVPSYVFASLLSFSRIESNKHFFSDIVAGAAIGTLVGLGTAAFHKKEFSQFFIVPSVDEDQVGLSFIFPF